MKEINNALKIFNFYLELIINSYLAGKLIKSLLSIYM